MGIQKELSELLGAGVISEETARQIEGYYLRKKEAAPNRMFAVFAALGAMLTGLGIILLVAHNWDELARVPKTIIAFLPLLVGQALCAYSLIKKQGSAAWSESSSVFTFLAMGAVISLVAQIYHIPGDLGPFLRSWMLLCIPLVYIMRSSMAACMYLVGITWYGVVSGYGSGGDSYYWLLILLVLPHYYRLFTKTPESNFLFPLNWLIALSVSIMLGSIAHGQEEFLSIAYVSLFGIFYMIGDQALFKDKRPASNSYLIIGSLGTIGTLLGFSFDYFWKHLSRKSLSIQEDFGSLEFAVAMLLSVIAAVLLIRKYKQGIRPADLVFLLFLIAFITGCFTPLAVILVNLIILVTGFLTIKKGAKDDHLGIYNYGLLIIAALAACRFFDERISFMIRGALFITVGIGFFAANFIMLKRRKKDE